MKLKSLLIAGVAACVSTHALAQETTTVEESNGARLDEIVVTAQKRSENIQDVPIAVSAVSAQELEAAGVISTIGLSSAVAGLTISVNSNYFSPNLRGVSSSFFGPGIENPVGLYVDGVYYGSQLSAPTDLSNVSQVAVLKGPQGTLFGRNSTGGVIQMTTRAPEAEFGGEFSTELDNYTTSRNFAYVTGEVAQGLTSNLSLTYTTQGEGWGQNLVTGEDIHKIDHDLGVRNRWQFNAGNFAAHLDLDYSHRRDSLGANIRPVEGRQQNLHGLAFNPANFPDYLIGPIYTGGNYESSNMYDVANNRNNRNGYEGGGVGLTLEQDFGAVRLVSITGYREFKFRTFTDTDSTTDPANDLDLNQRSQQISQELQLLSPDDPGFNWVAGLYYYQSEDILDPLIQNFGFFGPLFGGATSPAFISPVFLNLFNYQQTLHMKNETESLAGFAQATVRLFDETRLTGGVRVTHERRSMRGSVSSAGFNADGSPNTDAFFDFGFPFPVVEFVDNGAVGPVNPAAIETTEPTWRLALDHRFTPDVLGYVSYNRGYKSGGHNALDPLGNGRTYRPETVDAYEVGLKMELFGNTLRLNPSVFYNQYQDLQVLNLNSVLASVRNADQARMYGVDVEGDWQARDDLRFTFSAEWLNAEITSFPNYPYVIEIPGGGVTDFGGFLPPRDGAGQTLPYAPEFVLNVGANYTMHVADAKIIFNVTNTYNDGYFYELANLYKSTPFNLLNASLTWVSPNERIRASIWGRNLVDEIVPSQVYANTSPASGGIQGDYANPPLTYGISLGFTF